MSNYKITVSKERCVRISDCGEMNVLPKSLSTSLASSELANEIVRLFNYSDGCRALNCRAAFFQIRKIFGSTINYVFGIPATDDFKMKIASAVAEGLRAFLLSGLDQRVTLFDRTENELVPFEGVTTGRKACYGRALLVSTLETSKSFDIPVYLRLDVKEPSDERSLLDLERVLFTDEQGRSLAGIADIMEYVEDLEMVDRAFRELLGQGCDVLTLNARLFRAWEHAAGDEFAIDIGDLVVDEPAFDGDLRCRFVREQGVLRIVFESRGDKFSVREVAKDASEFVPEWTEVKRELQKFRDVFCGLSVGGAIKRVNFDHIFDCDHLARFSDSFQEMFVSDGESAGTAFYDSLDEALGCLRENDESWMPFFYDSGRNKNLAFFGQKSDVSVSLLVPLYLTENDRAQCVPSVYLVASLKKGRGGDAVCSFPTVLSPHVAELNHRRFRRSVRRSRYELRHFVEEVA